MATVYTAFLILGLLASGISIPLILTFQNHRLVDEPIGDKAFFKQPLLQTTMVFLGEIICILAIHLERKSPSLLDRSLLDTVQPDNTGNGDVEGGENDSDWVVPRTATWTRSSFWFVLPSACDLVSTTLMNMGLILSTPSVFQIMRSSILGFSAVLCFFFLSHRFSRSDWASVAMILAGTALVAFSAAREHNCTGPVLLVVAQLFVSAQFVLEEYLMKRYNINHVRAMGIEGVFGTVLITLTLVVAALSGVGVFDIRTGVVQLFHSYVLWQSAALLSLMVAVFNFFSFAVSKAIKMPVHSVIDTVRMAAVWIIAIHYSWDTFSWLELAGLVIQLVGVYCFNGAVTVLHGATKSVFKWRHSDETAPLLAS